MGVCFIGEKRGKFGEFVGESPPPRGPKSRGIDMVPADYPTPAFVAQYTTPESTPGHLVTPTGTILGSHSGLWHYTIGQRARIPGMKEKWFVASKRPETNSIVVVPGADHPALSCVSLKTDHGGFSWVGEVPEELLDEEGLRARCQVRHRMKDVAVIVRRIG